MGNLDGVREERRHVGRVNHSCFIRRVGVDVATDDFVRGNNRAGTDNRDAFVFEGSEHVRTNAVLCRSLTEAVEGCEVFASGVTSHDAVDVTTAAAGADDGATSVDREEQALTMLGFSNSHRAVDVPSERLAVGVSSALEGGDNLFRFCLCEVTGEVHNHFVFRSLAEALLELVGLEVASQFLHAEDVGGHEGGSGGEFNRRHIRSLFEVHIIGHGTTDDFLAIDLAVEDEREVVAARDNFHGHAVAVEGRELTRTITEALEVHILAIGVHNADVHRDVPAGVADHVRENALAAGNLGNLAFGHVGGRRRLPTTEGAERDGVKVLGGDVFGRQLSGGRGTFGTSGGATVVMPGLPLAIQSGSRFVAIGIHPAVVRKSRKTLRSGERVAVSEHLLEVNNALVFFEVLHRGDLRGDGEAVGSADKVDGDGRELSKGTGGRATGCEVGFVTLVGVKVGTEDKTRIVIKATLVGSGLGERFELFGILAIVRFELALVLGNEQIFVNSLFVNRLSHSGISL